MTNLDVLAAIREERVALASLLAELPDSAWATPSACAGWTVKDVVAHLTLSTQASWRQFIAGMITHRGNFDRMELLSARDESARRSPPELVETLRASADSSRHAPFSKPLDRLVDIVVHSHDIARPLGQHHGSNIDRTRACIEHVTTSKFYGAKHRLQGLRLTATDTPWQLGHGAAVTGPIIDLLLVVTGRPAGLCSLGGDGRDVLTERITHNT
jgi:uncharacterized protein (TIGR03083 family)